MVPDARWEDLDPLEFERFRRMIRESRGRSDAALAELPDQEIAKALGAVESNHEVSAVRVLGLLLFGREDAIRRYLPTHEVAFQVLFDTRVVVNEFFKWPLLAHNGGAIVQIAGQESRRRADGKHLSHWNPRLLSSGFP